MNDDFIVVKIPVTVNRLPVRIFDDGAHDAVDVHAGAVDNQAGVFVVDDGRLIDNRRVDGLREGNFRLVFEGQERGIG